MAKTVEEDRKIDWQPLRELALKTPYTMEYLSLMARRKQLKVKKVGRLWYSTLRNIKEFEKEMKKRKEMRRERMRATYFKKSTTSAKTRVSQAVIFDQIQAELEEVLAEIRAKERRLREEYRGEARIPISLDPPVRPKDDKVFNSAYVKKEERETEELSEKLIMDLGKLLNTANQIQDDVEVADSIPRRSAKNLESESDEYAIPIRSRGRENKQLRHHPIQQRGVKTNGGEAVENHSPFLSLNYPNHHHRGDVFAHEDEIPRYHGEQKKKGSLLRTIMLTMVGLLAFLMLMFILFLVYLYKG